MLYSFENFTVDTERREVRRGGEPCAVEPQVFDVLEYLIRNRDRVVSRDDLLAGVWSGRIVSESTLASRINAVRNAIDDNGEDQRLIRTILRRGVRFVGAVHEQAIGQRARAVETRSSNLLTLPDRPSIAVLPFDNLSGHAEQDYF